MTKTFPLTSQGWQQAKEYNPHKKITKVVVLTVLGISYITIQSLSAFTTVAFIPEIADMSRVAFKIMSKGV